MTKLSGFLAAAVLLAAPVAYAQDGSSCANAMPLAAADDVSTDTTGATDWNSNYGPLVSPSNDLMYTFTANGGPTGDIMPVSSDYAFAMYLLSSCNDGAQPAPIASTGTIGSPISLAGLVTDGTQYWLAVTGTAAGGAGANGVLNFTTPDPLPVSLQSFSIE